MAFKKHLECMAAILLQYRTDPILCDALVMVDDGELHAHGVILSAASPVFKTALTLPNVPHCVRVSNVNMDVMKLALDAIYTGRMECEDSKRFAVKQILFRLEVDVHKLDENDCSKSLEIAVDESIVKCELEECVPAARDGDVPDDPSGYDPDDPTDDESTRGYDSIEKMKCHAADFMVESREVPKTKPFFDELQSEGVVKRDNLDRSGLARGLSTNDQVLSGADGRYDCKYCSSLFTTCMALKRHVMSQHGTRGEKRDHICDICQKRFSRPSGLSWHRANVHKLRTMRRQACMTVPIFDEVPSEKVEMSKNLDMIGINRTATTADDLIESCADVKNDCRYCSRSFTTCMALKRHVKSQHGINGKKRDHTCDICQKRFSRPSGLSWHRTNVHKLRTIRRQACITVHKFDEAQSDRVETSKDFDGNELTGTASTTDNPIQSCADGRYDCKYCSSSFKTHMVMKKHVMSQHGKHGEKRAHTCDICGMHLAALSCLRNHRANVHKRELCAMRLRLCTAVPKFEVTQSVSFETREKPHMDGLTGSDIPNVSVPSSDDVIYDCDYCSNSFKSRTEMIRHVKLQHGQYKEKREHICDICQKRFASRPNLRTHRANVHEQELRTMRRQVCATTAVSQFEEKREYICDICQKHFAGPSSLKNHRASVHHKEQSWILCQTCGTKVHKWYLKTHVQRHHSGKREFKCDACPAAFERQLSCAKHKEKVHGVDNPRRSFICKDCGACFVSTGARRFHKRKWCSMRDKT